MNDSVSQLVNLTVGDVVGVMSGGVAIPAIVVGVLVVAPLPAVALVAYFGVAARLYKRPVKPRALRAGHRMNEETFAVWRTSLAAFGGLQNCTSVARRSSS